MEHHVLQINDQIQCNDSYNKSHWAGNVDLVEQSPPLNLGSLCHSHSENRKHQLEQNRVYGDDG